MRIYLEALPMQVIAKSKQVFYCMQKSVHTLKGHHLCLPEMLHLSKCQKFTGYAIHAYMNIIHTSIIVVLSSYWCLQFTVAIKLHYMWLTQKMRRPPFNIQRPLFTKNVLLLPEYKKSLWSTVFRSSPLVTYAKAISLLIEIAKKGKRNQSNMSIHRWKKNSGVSTV
jgi:hypothetical protein